MAQTIGIIGGADGPTAVFVTGNPAPAVLSFLLAAGILILLLKHFRKK